MEQWMDMFTAVGDHFNAVLVGCIECAVAIFYWDGKESLTLDFQKGDASWVRMYATCNPEQTYDVIRFWYCTEIYAQMAEYEARLQRAEDESQAKTTFLSRMSHEIRTPMNGPITSYP